MLSRAGFRVVPRPLLYWVASELPETSALADLSDAAYQVRTTARGTICAYHQYHLAKHAVAGESVADIAADAMRSEFLRFRYLNRSFQPVIDRLTRSYLKAGGRFMLSTKVTGIRARPDGLHVHTSRGRFRAKRVTVSRHLSWPVFGVDDRSHKKPNLNVHRSVLTLVESTVPIPLFYVNLVGHPWFAAVQVSEVSSDTDSKCHVYSFCMVTGHDAFADLPAAVTELMTELGGLGLVPEDCKVREISAVRRMVLARRSADLQASVDKLGTALCALIVDNLAQDMSENVDVWAQAVGSLPEASAVI